METKTKKTLLISTIILLIVINISALSTIYYHKNRAKRFVEMKNMKEEVRIQGMHCFIKEELKLNDKQFELFKEISKTNMDTLHKITEELNHKRHNMMNEIAKKNPNYETLDNIAQDIGSLHYKLKKSTINHFIELKEICNEEQQENLQHFFMHVIQEQDQNNLGRKTREQGRNSEENRRNRNRKPQKRN